MGYLVNIDYAQDIYIIVRIHKSYVIGIYHLLVLTLLRPMVHLFNLNNQYRVYPTPTDRNPLLAIDLKVLLR